MKKKIFGAIIVVILLGTIGMNLGTLNCSNYSPINLLNLLNTSVNENSKMPMLENVEDTGEMGNILHINVSYVNLHDDKWWIRVLREVGNYSVTTMYYEEVINDTSLADPFDVILIGDSYGDWKVHNWTPEEARAIADIGLPIVARGRGGCLFVFALGMAYSNYGIVVFDATKNSQIMDPAKENHTVLNHPYDLPLAFPIDTTYLRSMCIFKTNDPEFEIIGYLQGYTSDNYTNFGYYTGYENNPNILIWGYLGYFWDPTVTTVAKQFCINQVESVRGENFKGCGMLRIDKQRFIGKGNLLLSKNIIDIEISEQKATWDIFYHCEKHDFELFYGIGDLGSVVLVIYRGETSYAVAMGRKVFFYGET